MLLCNGDANVTECVVSSSIRYTRFHWLNYNLKRSCQQVNRTCLERGCVRSFHERQKQKESEMKGLILLIRLWMLWLVTRTLIFLWFNKKNLSGNQDPMDLLCPYKQVNFNKNCLLALEPTCTLYQAWHLLHKVSLKISRWLSVSSLTLTWILVT